MSGSAAGFADEIAIGRYGTRPAHRRDVVLRATLPDLLARDDDDRRAQAADELYFRGAAYDGYESGRWIHSHKPELRTIVEPDGGRYRIGEDRAAMEGDAAAGSVRQEIEAIGIPASVLIAVDRPRAFELPATKLGAAGSLRVFPRWSGEAALRVGGGEGDTFITLSHAHYVAFSRAQRRARRGSRRCRAARADRAGRVPRGARGSRAPAGEPGGHPRRPRTSPRGTRSQRSRARCAQSTATRSSRARLRRASIQSRASCWASTPATASCSPPPPCCCCGSAAYRPAT